MVRHQFSAAGVEHFRTVYSSISMAVPEHISDPISGPLRRNLHLGGTPIAATVKMVSGILPPDSPIWKIMTRGAESMEYELAGTALWLLTLSTKMLELLDAVGWLEVPIVLWKDVLKPKLDWVRRAGMFEDYVHDDVYQLRKMVNVSYRRDNEADWADEKIKRRSMAHFKSCVSDLNYTRYHAQVAGGYIQRCVNAVAARSDSGSLEWWWHRRHHHIPGGSTSHGAAARQALRSDNRFVTGDRPGKKTVAEMLPSDFWKELLSYPPVNAARASTKHEPGDKRRALYASNEIPYLISAYASVHFEKAMKEGVCARQSPEDSAEWTKWAAASQCYHLSTDYSDYNSEHTLHDLMVINLLRARAWLKNACSYSAEKASAGLWLAAAISNSWVEWPDECTRIISGLYSGSRDTMRDHCDRHYADIHVAIADARNLGYSCNLVSRGLWLAGDDEDLGFTDVAGAIVYSNILPMEGHNTNPKKQMGGSNHHEFLQVMSHRGSTMMRPAAALIATLASGNWYVPTATWYDGLINGISDNYWEAHVRGLPYECAFHMACAYLDTALRVRRPDGSYHALEWWNYRSPGRVHPLWGVKTAAAPVVREYPTPRSSWPSQATDDWLSTVKKQLEGLPERKVANYRDALLQSSHGSAFLRWRQGDLEKQVMRDWPARVVRRYAPDQVFPQEALTREEMADLYSRVGVSTRPRDVDELAARMGVDPVIVTMRGEAADMAFTLRGKDWAHYATPLSSRALTPAAAASTWSFRSWAGRAAEDHPLLHLMRPAVPAKHVRYVYAPNGAGKTTLCRRYPAIKDLDSATALHAARRISYRRAQNAPASADLYMYQVLAYMLRDVRGELLVLGNYPVSMVARVCATMRVAFKGANYIPGWDLCRARLLKRGETYSNEKIDELQSRYIPYNLEFSTVQELLDFMKVE